MSSSSSASEYCCESAMGRERTGREPTANACACGRPPRVAPSESDAARPLPAPPGGLDGFIKTPGAVNAGPAASGCVDSIWFRGDVPGEKPLIRTGVVFADGEARGGEPIGPKSTEGDEPWRPAKRCGLEGVDTGNGPVSDSIGDDKPFVGLSTLPLLASPSSRVYGACASCASNLPSFCPLPFVFLLPNASCEVKSASRSAGAVSAGAGAALEMEIGSGGRALFGSTRVGAVEPGSNGLLR